MVADKSSSAGEITEQPIHGNGDSAAQAVADQAENSGGKSYRTEEFVRVRKQLVDRLDRVKEEIARVDAEDVGRKVADWVKENPLLSAAIAAGTGIVLGRGLMSLLSTPEPPTLAARTRKRARNFSRQAQHFAGDLGDLVTDRASDAGDFVLRTAGEARTQVSRKAGALLYDPFKPFAENLLGELAGFLRFHDTESRIDPRLHRLFLEERLAETVNQPSVNRDFARNLNAPTSGRYSPPGANRCERSPALPIIGYLLHALSQRFAPTHGKRLEVGAFKLGVNY